jgi:hypothetical protein
LLLQDDLGKNSPNSPVFEECFFWIATFLPTGSSEYQTKISKDSYNFHIWSRKFSVFSLLFNLISYWEMQLVDLHVNLYLDLNQILGA